MRSTPEIILAAIPMDGEHLHVPYIYLHGRAQEMSGFDLLRVIKHKGTIAKPGLYDCNVAINGVEYGATMFLWYCKFGFMLKGLVVMDDDLPAYVDAFNKYHNQVAHI